MVQMLGLAMLAGLCLFAAAEQEFVKTLTSQNYTEAVNKAPFALVEFYAPWCGHCKTLAPHYEAAAKALTGIDDKILLAKVDATEEKDLASKYGISGFPTLKWIVDGVDGSISDYQGGRTEEDIVRWVQKKSGPPAATLGDAAQLTKAKAADDVLVVGFFSDFKGADHDAFLKLARATDDVVFYQTSDKAVAKELGLKSSPSFAVGRNESEGFQLATSADSAAFKGGKDTLDSLTAFIQAEKLPLYLEFGPSTQSKIFGAGIPKQVIVIGSPKQLYGDPATLKAIRAAHDEQKGKLVFVTGNTEEKITDNIVKYFGVPSDADSVQVVGFDSAGGKKFFMKEKLTPSSFVKFAADFAQGTLTPDYKSDPLPEPAMEDEVSIVVGKNFEEVVMDPKKDVFLEVYAPWCGHCKALTPTWGKLAKRFKKVDSVTIAKMDGTTNEHGAATVQGFPTLLFFPAGGDKNPVTYTGARDLKDLTKFVTQTASTEFELPKKGKKEEGSKDEL